jgi:4,5-dihydroxyphthalate decarboxylase
VQFSLKTRAHLIGQRMPKVVLRTNLGDYPAHAALKNGIITSDLVELQFNGPAQVHRSFKDMVRGDTYDAGELAIVTLLQARARGLPLVMLPVSLTAGIQHKSAIYCPRNGRLSPKDIEGKSVGIRSYAQTTGLWLRGILQHEHGVRLDRVTWNTIEDGHVSGYPDPLNSVRLSPGSNLEELLLRGELSAIIQNVDLEGRSEIQTLIPAAEMEAKSWSAREGIIPVNHVLVLHRGIAEEQPYVVKELFRLIVENRGRSGGAAQTLPLGFEENRRWLEIVVAWAFEQKLIDRKMDVSELFCDTTATL